MKHTKLIVASMFAIAFLMLMTLTELPKILLLVLAVGMITLALGRMLRAIRANY